MDTSDALNFCPCCIIINRGNLARQLMAIESPGSLYSKLSESLLKNYKAEQIRLFIFTSVASPREFNGIRFMETTARVKYLFSGIFNYHRPLCGSLQDEHIRALFEDDAGSVHSTVLIPMEQRGWEGLLALGSRQWNCYRQGLALELLVLISDITEQAINRFLKLESERGS